MICDDVFVLMICDMGEDVDFMDMSEFCVDIYNCSQKYYFICDSENDVIFKVYFYFVQYWDVQEFFEVFE